ncbi:hypothetical protein AVEN_17604-1 [Araneus ventricosus]|uniref:Transposable element Tc1 transposase n=1 Tax=Araneus ventricosus TaxID=182803 RepID=A0A4Y2L8N2_ARAVE|nr:hypothetical protein AVEN_17604-1 [Araneus ventricosus]
MLNKPETYWNNGLFADESKFNILGSDGRIMVWRRKNEEINPKNLVGTVKYGGGGVLVWGCISASWLGSRTYKRDTLQATVVSSQEVSSESALDSHHPRMVVLTSLVPEVPGDGLHHDRAAGLKPRLILAAKFKCLG